MQQGKLFVISAPSGAGKTTLVKRVILARPELKFSISYTTRPARPGEQDRIDYFFLDRNEFKQMHDEGAFLEHAEVFGNFYGTGKQQVTTLCAAGNDVLLEIDWQGAQQVMANDPDCTSIFILPPSIEELERRLRGRATDNEEVIRQRLSEAIDDISHWTEFNHVVINAEIEQAETELLRILSGTAVNTQTRLPEVRNRVRQLLSHV
ncbi:MAG TPA: guanylate kinase [Gammaproteobacteria bacterium]|jgi:guanylate kinase|nr:guanylate kinase [Chromatiales bacterium]MCP4925151.1 guanylate kinase [Gammaproteobacteria bacterium]MDP7152989.1 guanylate kinase [Gammaproteobacteria bacterium]MDP7660383.1 guanylate kinase [Gammaproteobacteria bacterium]HJP39683.1 guanylate kinase [Gammaproteobacteria bacterium]